MDNKNSTKVMGYLDGGDVCRSRKDQREATCRKIPLHLVDDLLRLPLDPPLSLLPLLHAFPRHVSRLAIRYGCTKLLV